MQNRRFGRTDWQVSEVGFGMWGMAGWSGWDDDESRSSQNRSAELACNFSGTAWAVDLYLLGPNLAIAARVLMAGRR